jgi:hypothetical protein
MASITLYSLKVQAWQPRAKPPVRHVSGMGAANIRLVANITASAASVGKIVFMVGTVFAHERIIKSKIRKFLIFTFAANALADNFFA